MLRSSLLVISLVSTLVVACSGSDDTSTPGGDNAGGEAGTSGSSGSGGSGEAGIAGSSGSSGSSGSGGSSQAGSAGTGGSGGDSGAAGAGATAATGGSGGTAGSGGSGATGGSGAQGGSAGNGASSGAGGTAGDGGTAGVGGSSGTGGTAGVGGTSGGSGGTGGVVQCPEGYEGVNCDQCSFGYVMHEGACVLACDVKDCGNGICSLTEDNTTYCTCNQGWAGTACDVCAPGYRFSIVPMGETPDCELDEPSTTNLALWLDADLDDSFQLGAGNTVLRWYSRVPGDSTYFSDGGVASARPVRASSEVSARRWVNFDGVDDRLRRSLGLKTAGYSIFMVVQASSVDTTQTLLSGVSPMTNVPGIQLQSTSFGNNIFFRHKTPVNGGVSDDVTLQDYPTTSATVVEVHRGALGNQFVYQLFDGVGYVSTPGTAPAFTEDLLMYLGIRGDSTTLPLEGRIGEVLIFSTTVPMSDRAKVRDYLKAKWTLLSRGDSRRATGV